jgi:hypothetical protein
MTDEATHLQDALAARALAFLVDDGKAMRTLWTVEEADGRAEAVASAGWTIARGVGATKEEAVRAALDAYDEACRE